MALEQEGLEKKSLSKGLESIQKKQFSQIWPIWESISNTLKSDEKTLFSLLEKAPKHLSCVEAVDRYINNFNDYWLYKEMKTIWWPYDYMNRKHQKSFAKAYFIGFLKKNFEFCDKKWYAKMAQAMRYNYKDEQWIWLESSSWNSYDSSEYIYPDTSTWEDFKWEPHEKRREYEYHWMKREYNKLWISKNLNEKNIWTELFNRITWLLLSKDDEQTNYERVWAIMFLEKYIPHEFRNMKISRDRNFPWLSRQERHYIDDHIEHDIEYHYEDITKGIEEMNPTQSQREMIKSWMHKIYTARELMYSAYAWKNNNRISKIDKIINLPVFKKMRYWVAVSLLVVSWLLLDENNKNIDSSIYNVSWIEEYQEEVAREYWLWESYSDWTDFFTMDFVGYEALKRAIKDQKWIDI